MKNLHSAILSGFLICLLAAGCRGNRRPAGATEPRNASRAAIARAAFDRGSWAQASDIYRDLLRRARSLDEPRDIGNAAYNLAACHLQLNDLETAADLLAEARIELPRAGMPIADVLLVQARLSRRQGDVAAAGRHLRELETLATARPGPLHRFEASLLGAEMALDSGDVLTSRAARERAAAQYETVSNPLLQAEFHVLSGELEMLGKGPGAAAEQFDRAAALFRQGRSPEAMAAALRQAGEALARTGRRREAIDRLYRSARSFQAQKRFDSARKGLRSAVELARAGGDDDLLARLSRLENEMKAGVGAGAGDADPK